MANGAQMMSIRVLCIVEDGVEETELVAPVDILRRAATAVEFGLAVASHLVGEGVAQEVADAIMA